jgi:type II secretory pathway pseudopilin PulG
MSKLFLLTIYFDSIKKISIQYIIINHMNRSFEKSQESVLKMDKSEYGMSGLFSGKNFIIILLTGLLVLSFLGINLFIILGNWLQVVINIFGPLIAQILSVFGYTTGTVLDKTEDVATTVAKAGIDIAGGTVQSVADLLKKASADNVDPKARNQLDQSLGSMSSSKTPTFKLNTPEADDTNGTIQKPISSDKSQWCLVGDYQGKRGCIDVDDAAKCMSGQVFPSQQLCLNPTKTNFLHSQA